MTQAVDFAGYVVENKAYVVEKNYITLIPQHFDLTLFISS